MKKIILFSIAFLLICFSMQIKTDLCLAVSPAPTNKPQQYINSNVEDWKDTTSLKKSGIYTYRVIDEKNKQIELRKIDSQASIIIIPSKIDGYTVVSLGYSRGVLVNEVDLDTNASCFELFSNKQAIESVTMPQTVENIGVRAFYSLHKLTKITFTNNVKSIREYSFANCSNLHTIRFNDGVSIYATAFKGDNNVKKVYSKSFLALCEEESMFSSKIAEWHISQGADYGFGFYSFFSNQIELESLYVDSDVKKLRLATMRGDTPNNDFIKTMHVKGKKTKLQLDKNLNLNVEFVCGAQGIKNAKKAHISYFYYTLDKMCLVKKSNKKQVCWKSKKKYKLLFSYNSKKSKWKKTVKRVAVKYKVYGKNNKSSQYKFIKNTRRCKIKIPYNFVKVVAV